MPVRFAVVVMDTTGGYEPSVKRVFTYFEPLGNSEQESVILGMWQESWQRHGWVPCVLRRCHASAHPLYATLVDAVWRLPTVNSRRYELACYLRYLAMAVVGGGLMTDWDVVNQRYTEPYRPTDDVLVCLTGNAVPCAVAGSAAAYEGFARICAEWPPDVFDITRGRPHISDMTIAQRLAAQGRVRVVPICAEWGQPGWEDAALVHCSGPFAWAKKVSIMQECVGSGHAQRVSTSPFVCGHDTDDCVLTS